MRRQHRVCKLSAVHSRHDHIRNQQIDSLRESSSNLQRLGRAVGIQHLKAGLFQIDSNQFPQQILILYQQDGAASAHRRRNSLRVLGLWNRVHHREIDVKSCPLAELAAGGYAAIALHDDPINLRQA